MLDFVGPHGAVQIFGVKLVGINADNLRKLVFTICYITVVILVSRLLRWISAVTVKRAGNKRVDFWTNQFIHVATAGLLIVGILSIWFDDPNRLASALGLATAGVAFAMQRVITAFAAYFVLLRGRSFNVGDRITMGGVRGDVIALDFIQTTIMEMGQPPGEQADAPSMWVRARQYTGRIVTVTNDKIFDEPVYNYSREFPYIWDEMQVPIAYTDDRNKAEKIILEAAERHTERIADLGEERLADLERRYSIHRADLNPRVFMRLTDNWVEFSVRFVCKTHGVREVKDRMSRDIINALDEAKIGIASATSVITGWPPLKIEGVDLARRS